MDNRTGSFDVGNRRFNIGDGLPKYKIGVRPTHHRHGCFAFFLCFQKERQSERAQRGKFVIFSFF